MKKIVNCLMVLLLIVMFGCGEKFDQESGGMANGSVVAESAKIEKLAGGFKFTEGPAVDTDGNLFFNRRLFYHADNVRQG